MQQLSGTITWTNVDKIIKEYMKSVESLGASITDLKGLRLLEALKRGVVEAGLAPSSAAGVAR